MWNDSDDSQIRRLNMETDDTDVEMSDAYLASSSSSSSSPSFLSLSATEADGAAHTVFRFSATTACSDFKRPFSFKKPFKFKPVTKSVERTLGFSIFSETSSQKIPAEKDIQFASRKYLDVKAVPVCTPVSCDNVSSEFTIQEHAVLPDARTVFSDNVSVRSEVVPLHGTTYAQESNDDMVSD